MSSRFCKPSKASGDVVSRHIYVAGLGQQLGTSKTVVREIFQKFGLLDDATSPNEDAVEFVEGKRYCYVSYVSEASAKAAVDFYAKIPDEAESSSSSNHIDSVPKLLVKYASISESKETKVMEAACTSQTRHIEIPGLTILEDFISPELEAEILDSEICRADSPRWEELLSRRIQHYGLIFNYRTLMLDYSTPVAPMPGIVQENILPRVTKALASTYPDGILPYDIQQLTANEYNAGQGIANHIDTDACLGPDIAIVSLGSGVVMTFQERRPVDSAQAAIVDYYPTPPVVARTILPAKSASIPAALESPPDEEVALIEDNEPPVVDEETKEGVSVPMLSVVGAGSKGVKKYIRRKYVYLPPRSLLLMQGEARYNWSHGITPRASDKVEGELIPRQRRVSLTFRQVMLPGEQPPSRLQSSALEVDHVFKVYDSIAVHWNHTRGRRKVYWQRVKSFIEDLPKGSLVADIGSGDGKYFGVAPGLTIIGCDRSLKLLEVSRDSSHDTFCCDAVKLPLASDMFDAALCIAVLHHLASLDRRIALLRELLRITRVGGEIMIQAWALEQDASSRWDFAGTGQGKQCSSAGIESSSAPSVDPTTSTAKQSCCGTAMQDVLVPWKLQQRFFMQTSDGSVASQVDEVDCEHVVKQDDGSLLFQRYCHVFKKGELEDLCSSCPGNRVLESGWDRGNWFVRLQKTSIVVDESIDRPEDDVASIPGILAKAGVAPTGAMPRQATRL